MTASTPTPPPATNNPQEGAVLALALGSVDGKVFLMQRLFDNSTVSHR